MKLPVQGERTSPTFLIYLQENHQSAAAKNLLDFDVIYVLVFTVGEVSSAPGRFEANARTSAEWLLALRAPQVENMWNGTKRRTRFHNILDPKLDPALNKSSKTQRTMSLSLTDGSFYERLYGGDGSCWLVRTPARCRGRGGTDRTTRKNNDTHLHAISNLVFLTKICREKGIKSTRNQTVASSALRTSPSWQRWKRFRIFSPLCTILLLSWCSY